MPKRGWTGVGRWCVVAGLCLVATAASAGPHRVCRHHCRIPFLYDHRGFDGVPLIPIEPPEYGLPPDTLPEYHPQEVPGPSAQPWLAPYPQGFVLDVPITPDETDDQPAPEKLTRYREVADALARCWRPPADFDGRPWSQATLRVSFKRNGAINGIPLIPFVGGDLTPNAQSDLKTSLLSALRACAPLPFSPGLGAAVAGQIFALRFINQDQN